MSMIKNVGRLFVSKFLGQAVMLAAVIYFSRTLTPTELGTYFYFISVLGATGILADLGVSGASEKLASEKQNHAKWNTTALTCIMGFCIVVMTGMLITFQLGIYIISPELITYFGIALVADRIARQYEHLLRAELRAGRSGIIKLGRSVGFVVFALLLLNIQQSPALIIAATLTRVSVVPIAISLTSTSLTTPSLSAAQKLVEFGVFYSINVIGNKMFIFADVILIGILLTPADVARYEVAWKLIFGVISLNTVVALTAFSYISKEGNEAVEEINETLRSALLIPLPAAVGSALLGHHLVRYLFTESYAVSTRLMTVLGMTLIFQSLYFVFSRAAIALGGERKAFVATLVAVISNIGLNLFLIPRLGILGGAIATTASFGIASTVFYLLLSRMIKVDIPYFDIGLQLLAAIVMGSVLFGVGLTTSSPGNVIGLIVVGIVAYFTILLLPKRSRQQLYLFV